MMGRLLLTRTAGEKIRLWARSEVDADELKHQLRTHGILLEVVAVKGGQVKLGIRAPRCVTILRTELDDDGD
ncbi:carbon storage regulator [Burkholderia pyrrocinia]|uniref:carbon storage regulator n=1 Tax=Burkholderia pyrrocinia TaxID=60550 RepID=UPI001FB56CE3|nr:carbon storage regulator [Burkholderia pyrrocinia]UOB57012.1 carbon storage regulator [Burkholderia pyrrocinia]